MLEKPMQVCVESVEEKVKVDGVKAELVSIAKSNLKKVNVS